MAVDQARLVETLRRELQQVMPQMTAPAGPAEAIVDVRSLPRPPSYVLTVERDDVTGLITRVFMEPV